MATTVTLARNVGTGWGESGYLRIGRGSNECGLTTLPLIATVEGGSLAPPPDRDSGRVVVVCTGLACYSSFSIIAVIGAAALFACCCVWLISRLFCKRQPSPAPGVVAGGDEPMMFIAQAPDGQGGFRPVVVSNYAVGAPLPAGSVYSPGQPVQSQDPAALAAAAAAADDAAFEAATYAAIVASAAEARQQQSGRNAAAQTFNGGGQNRSLRVAHSIAAQPTVAMLPGMPPPYAPGFEPDAHVGVAAVPPVTDPAPPVAAELLIDYRANTPAMRALLASQRRALGLPLPAQTPPVLPPPSQQRQQQQQQAWDPEA
jgi:hypothetical protein